QHREDISEIVRGAGRRVLREIGDRLQRATAGADAADRKHRGDIRLQGAIVIEVALERHRVTRAPLVDEDDVSLVMQGREDAGGEIRVGGGGHAGSAGEKDYRIADRWVPAGREEDDAERDAAATPGGAILVDEDGAALRDLAHAGDEAGRE